MDEAVKLTGSNTGPDQSALEERFPRIAQALCELWSTEACAPYLSSLVFDERGGRQGFPPDVSTELFMLYQLLDFRKASDIWTEADI